MASIFERLRSDGSRRLAVALAAFFLVVAAAFAVRQWSSLFGVPEVVGGNFDLSQREIPANARSIDFYFSTDLDPASASATGAFVISPALSGSVSSSGNVLSFRLSDRLEAGGRYAVTLGRGIRSARGRSADADRVVELRVVSPARVLGILPSATLDDLSKNIVVMFSVPMAALGSTLADAPVACPVAIRPAIAGKCRWTSPTVLEFDPDAPLDAATRYDLAVYGTGLLYPLESTRTGSFRTSPIAVTPVTDAGTFDPTKGIVVRANADLDPAALAKNIEIKASSGVVLPAKVERFGATDALTYLLTSPSVPLRYATSYSVTVKAGLASTRGNVPLESDISFSVASRPFLDSLVSVAQRVSRTATGIERSVVGRFVDLSSFMPTVEAEKTTAFILSLPAGSENAAIPDNSMVTLVRHSSDGKNATIPLNVETIPPEERARAFSGAGMAADDASASSSGATGRILRVTAKEDLAFDTEYRFFFATGRRQAGADTETLAVRTPPKPAILDVKIKWYTLACLYSNVELDPQALRASMRLVGPGGGTGAVRSVSYVDRSYGVGDWYRNAPENCYSSEASLSNGYWYEVNFRPRPNSDYKLSIDAGVQGQYGGELPAYESPAFKTGETPAKDRYAYHALADDRNVIPSDVPLVVGFQTINTASLTVGTCEMTLDQYVRFGPSIDAPISSYCSRNTRKTFAVANKFWEPTLTKLDVEKDVLGGLSAFPFVFTYASDAPDVATVRRVKSSALFIRSGLSVVREEAGGEHYLFVTGLDGSPVSASGTTFRFVHRDPEGGPSKDIALPVLPVAGKPGLFRVTVASSRFEDSANVAYVTTADGRVGMTDSQESVSNSDFGVYSWQDSSDRDYAYVYTDRPLYRPGDTVQFKGLARSWRPTGYRKTEASTASGARVTVYDAEGNRADSFPIALDARSNFSGKFVIPAASKLGSYRLEISYGTGDTVSFPVSNGSFFVEEYQKPLFKSVIEPLPAHALYGDTANIAGHAEYYFGGRVGAATYRYRVSSQRYYFDPREYSSYSFGTDAGESDCRYYGSCSYDDQVLFSSSGATGPGGDAKTSYRYVAPASDENSDDPNAERIYAHAVTFVDPLSGRSVTNSSEQIVHRTDAYVGIEADSFGIAGKPLRTSVVTLDHDARPLGGKDALVELVRVEWKTAKKQGVDGSFYNDWTEVRTVESSGSYRTDPKGLANVSFAPKHAGEYRLRATYSGKNGASYVSVASAYVAGAEEVVWNAGNNSIVAMTADKGEYAVGETAHVALQAPTGVSRVFVAVEKDDAVLDTMVLPASGSLVSFDLPVKAEYLPNFYVKAYAVGRPDQKGLPVYGRALANARVTTARQNLSVSVSTDKTNYAPGEAMIATVLVRDADGKPVANANGSLSVVDESLLALAGNPKLDPYAFFYRMKRYLGVETFLSLSHLVERLEVKDLSDGKKGGSGEGQKGGDTKRARGDFRDTAYWVADYATDANGRATVKIPKLPDNLTIWRLEAVANTDTRMGVAYSSATARQEVMVSANLPSFFVAGDRVILRPIVSNRRSVPQNFTVSLSGSGFSVSGESVRKISIGSGADLAAEFDIRIGTGAVSASGASVTVTVTDDKGAPLDAETRTLPVSDASVLETAATFGSARGAPKEEPIYVDPARRQGSLSIRYSASLFSSVDPAFGFFASYPYGCAEQQTSAVLPIVYRREIAVESAVPYDLSVALVDSPSGRVTADRAIRSYLGNIVAFQLPSGGFSYWKPADVSAANASDWLTAYVLEGFADIRSIGYEVDAGMTDRARSYLSRRLETADASRNDVTDLKILRAIVADEGSEGAGEAYRVLKNFLSRVDAAKLDVEAKTLLLGIETRIARGSSLQKADKDYLAVDIEALVNDLLSNQLVINSRGAFLSGDRWSADLASTARFVEALSGYASAADHTRTEIIDRMVSWLASRQKADGSYGSTVDTVAAVRAFVASLRASGELKNPNMDLRVALNGDELARTSVDQTNKLETFRKTVDLSALPERSMLSFVPTGSGTIHYDVALTHLVPGAEVSAREEGFSVSRAYYPYAEYERVKTEKTLEWARYAKGEIAYADLRYPDAVETYLRPATTFRVGDTLYVSSRLLLPEPRDYVAFESYVPAGTALVNTNFKTEDAGLKTQNPFFSYEEHRLDRYFGFAESLGAGEYRVGYVLRVTHAGLFTIPSTRVSEFYAPENFARTAGDTLRIDQ